MIRHSSQTWISRRQVIAFHLSRTNVSSVNIHASQMVKIHACQMVKIHASQMVKVHASQILKALKRH